MGQLAKSRLTSAAEQTRSLLSCLFFFSMIHLSLKILRERRIYSGLKWKRAFAVPPVGGTERRDGDKRV